MFSRPQILITAPFSAIYVERLKIDFDVVITAINDSTHPLIEGPHSGLISDAVVLICELDLVDRATIDKMPKLKLIVSCRGTPVNIDIAACLEKDIKIAHTPNRNADVTAELTMCLIVATVRNLFAANDFMYSKKWSKIDPLLAYASFRGPSLSGKTLGIVGAGAIGKKVAFFAKSFGCKVIFYDPFVHESEIQDLGSLQTLEGIFLHSDIVTIHAPLNDKTRNLIKKKQFDLLKAGSFFINVGRAGIVEESGFRAAIESGQIARAGLDVYWQEPLPHDHWLFSCPNVLLLPHIGGASDDVINNHSQIAFEAITNWRNGLEIKQIVSTMEREQ
jgi:phosphoglycerate dehydrogenase-like enzyme